ncbi:IgGFc-binding protein-like [Saccostrea cucullata]|uniref:IgGFc-binding protein-like n=1 Tax=Saccostrea cuccullata TaxID=36930 RepID=UPI002ED3BFDE
MNYSTAGKTGIQGRQFLVCVTDNLSMASDQTKTIYILSDGDFEFKLISKFSTQLFNEVVTPRINVREISVTSAISLSDFKIEEKALQIETSRDVFVIIIDNYIHTSDSTSTLPIKSTSNSYVISTPRAFSKTTGPQFAIASRRNSTTIKIHFQFDPDLPKKVNGITYQNGSVMHLVLHELETYEIYHRVDMSGTFIESTYPIAVFSGSYCTEIGFKNSTDFGSCSKLVNNFHLLKGWIKCI